MTEWKLYKRVGEIEARPWTDDEARHVARFSIAPYAEGTATTRACPSVNTADLLTAAARPAVGYVGRNPANHADQWYIAPDYFAKHYAEVAPPPAQDAPKCGTCGGSREIESAPYADGRTDILTCPDCAESPNVADLINWLTIATSSYVESILMNDAGKSYLGKILAALRSLAAVRDELATVRECYNGLLDTGNKILAERDRMREALASLVELYALPGESNLDRFERVAEMFRRETGCMAPGKDVSAASGDTMTHEERRNRWEAWYAERADRARKALASGSQAAAQKGEGT